MSDTLKAEMLERFEKEFILKDGYIKHLTEGQVHDDWHLLDVRDFLSTSIDQAFAAGRAEGIGEAREAVKPFVQTNHDECEDGFYSCPAHPGYFGNHKGGECYCGVATWKKVLTALDNLTKPDKE